jgi:hypothetical protein
MMERFLYQELAKAISKEITKTNPVEVNRTEYNGSFSVPNFVPSMDNIPTDTEVSLLIIFSFFFCLKLLFVLTSTL